MSRHCCIHTDEVRHYPHPNDDRPYCCRCNCYTDVADGDCDEPGDCHEPPETGIT